MAVGQRLGLSTAAVSRRLRGVVAFDVNELDLVADLLGVTISDLIAPERVSA